METGNIKWAAAVMASLAVIVDAAIETWWIGSPIRWSVLAGAAVCAASIGVSWRRLTWPSRATLSALLLLGLVAATAWLPGGLRAGIRIAGLSTSAVFILVTTASILFGAIVAWRFAVLPRAIRAGVVLIAVYAVSACFLALKGGVPFTDLFNGGSLWQRLPSWLQGGVLGGMVVLPFALLIAVARTAVPRLRTETIRSASCQVVALATSLALVVAALPVGAFWPSRDRAAMAATALPAPMPIVPSAALSETLENSLRAVEDGERESPRDRWDPAYVANTIGPDPAQLADWVAVNTFWIPYKGVLRGAPGVLMDRVGNSLDRALLLAQLLEAAGHRVRLAHGELPDQRAAELLPVLVAARPGGAARGAGSAPGRIDADDVRLVAAQYSLDGAAVERSVGSYHADSVRTITELGTRAADQNARLRTAVGIRPGAGDRSSRLEAAIEALRDHWWVQRQQGGAWIDMDLLSADRQAVTVAQQTLPVKNLDETLFHQVVVRVVSEQWSDGRVGERVAMQHTLRPLDVIGKPVALRFWPRRWPLKANPGSNPRQYIRTVALDQHEWLATLQIGRDTVEQISLLENGEVNPHPAVNDFARIGGSTAGAVDDVTSMLRGVTPEQTQVQDKKTTLTAVWLEYETRVPGEPARTSRRTVFDLLGPVARASSPVAPVVSGEGTSLVRSLSLMMETEILALGCRIAPDFYRHLVADSLLRNREVLRSIVRGEISEATDHAELSARLAPIPGPLYPLAIARFEQSRVGDQIFVASPNVLTRHVFPASVGGDRIILKDATDIVENEVGVDLRAKDGFATRFEQGVFDTNAETFLQARPKVAGNTANAFAAPGNWVTLTTANRAQLEALRVPEDDRRRIAADLAQGSTVVVPTAASRLAGEDFVGWWRIDPARGNVLGVDSRGWGDAAAGYMLLVSTVIGFELGWLMCELPPPSLPNTTARMSTPVMDHFVVPLEASGGECLVAGIVGAVLSVGLALIGGIGGFGPGIGGNKGGGGGATGGGGTGGGGGGNGSGGAGRGGGGGGGGGNGGGGAGAGEGGEGAGGGGAGGGGGRYSGPGGANPAEEVNPLGKTQPGTSNSAPKTQPSGPPSDMEAAPARPSPAPRPSGPVTPEEIADAQNDVAAAQRESSEATQDYVKYRDLKPNAGRNHPGDPSYDPVEDALKEDTMFQKMAKTDAAVDRLEQLQQAQAAQQRAQQPVGKGGGFQPPRPAAEPSRGLPGCPPNCGNDNKTGPAQSVQVPGAAKSIVGAAGVSKVIGGQ